MGLERLWRRREPEKRAATQSWWNLAGIPGLISSAAYGATLTEQALRNAASFACIDVLSDALGRTPLDAFRGGSGVAVPVGTPPSILARPSGVVLQDVWRYQLGFSMVTDGNAFGYITSTSALGWPNTIELLDPCTAKNRTVVGGVPQVEIYNEVHKLFPFGDVWHCPGRMVRPGSPFGVSPVEYASKVIGTTLSAEDFSNAFFAGGGHPTAILYGPDGLTEDEAKRAKEALRRATSQSNETAVMGKDWTYQQVQSNPRDALSADTMRFAVEQVCRFWRVPPSMVYGAVSGENVTYANVTDADLAFLKHSLDGYYVRVENALTAVLPRPQYVKANRNAILRADPIARATYQTMRIDNGTMSRNEARALEDERPITDGTGDKFYEPTTKPAAAPAPTPIPAGANGNGNGSTK